MYEYSLKTLTGSMSITVQNKGWKAAQSVKEAALNMMQGPWWKETNWTCCPSTSTFLNTINYISINIFYHNKKVLF